MQQIKKQLIKLKLDAIGQARFRFIKQTWKGQKVIREGPSRTLYFFLIFQRSEGSEDFCLAVQDDLTKQKTASGIEVANLISKLKKVEDGDIPLPKSILNPTKATPSLIKILDEGDASILSKTGFRRYLLKGGKLKGIWITFRQDEGSKIWTIKKGELV